jgi:hypothetical protein
LAAFPCRSVDRGKLFVFTPKVTFRAQAHQAIRLVFDAIFYGSASGR